LGGHLLAHLFKQGNLLLTFQCLAGALWASNHPGAREAALARPDFWFMHTLINWRQVRLGLGEVHFAIEHLFGPQIPVGA